MPELLRDYLSALNKPELTLDLAASLSGLLDGSEIEQRLAHELCVILKDGVRDGLDLSEVLKHLLRFSGSARSGLRNALQLEGIAKQGMLRRALTETIGDPLRTILGLKCRIRIWVLPAGSDEYLGLLAEGMKPDFRHAFEQKHRLPAIDAGYKKVPDTECLLLTLETAKAALQSVAVPEKAKALRWYESEDKLGLGSVVDETYTWHFPSPPLTEVASGVFVPTRGQKWSWALSFDFGSTQQKSDPLLLKLVDRFIRIVGAELDVALDKIVANGGSIPASETRSTTATSLATKDKIGSRKLESTTSSTRRYQDYVNLFRSEFACVARTYAESGETPRLWVYARGDPAVAPLVRWIEEMRNIRGAGVGTLLGPSGSGKQLLTKCVLGPGGRNGGFQSLEVTNGERFTAQLLGAEIGTWTSLNQRLVSPVKLAGDGGVVHVDELLSIMAEAPRTFASAKAPFEKIRVGDPVVLQNGTETWVPKALLIINGLEAHYAACRDHPGLKEWLGRFGILGRVPGWCDLTPGSRAVILRSCLLRRMEQRAATKAQIDINAFRWLVEKPEEPYFAELNMRGIETITEYAPILEGTLYLRVEQITDAIGWSAVEPAIEALAEDERWLLLGEGSAWLEGLNFRDKLIVKLSQLAGDQASPAGHISEADLLYAVQNVNNCEDVFDLAYLLYAAVRKLSKIPRGRGERDEKTNSRSQEDSDPKLTAPNRYQDYFASNSPWRDKVKQLVTMPAGANPATAIPGDFKLSGPSKGRPEVTDAFEKHVMQNVSRLQAEIERLACAHPPLYHVVPYWNWLHLIR